MADKAKEADDDAEKPAEGEGAEGEEGTKKGLPIKKILMIVVPVVLLLAGGAGAYFTGLIGGKKAPDPAAAYAEGELPAEGEHAAAEEEAAPEGDHGGGGEHGEKKLSGGPTFVKVADEKGQDLVVNLNSADGQMRFLQLGVQLELNKASDADKIKAVMPRVIDQFQTYLRELRVKDLRGSAGIYRLQMELLARVNQAAAPIKVKDVLFEKILIQ